MNKIKVFLKSSLFMIFFCIVNFFSKKSLTGDKYHGFYLNVSLTTYGVRLKSVFITIESIMSQSILPSTITLYISQKDIENCGVTSTLKRLQSRGLKIEVVNEDIRSYKKIFYEYIKKSNVSDSLIITSDDDVIYHHNWLEELFTGFTAHPNCVICHRGHSISLDENDLVLPYTHWGNSFNTPKHFMPTGVGGVLYPINSLLHLDKQKEDFIINCPTADDIWLKCLTLSNGFSSFLVNLNNLHPVPILSFKMKGLELINVYQNKNDIQFKSATEYFGIEWK